MYQNKPLRDTPTGRRLHDQQAVARRLFKKYHGMIASVPSITLFTNGEMYAIVYLGGNGVRPAVVSVGPERRVRWEGLCQMINDTIIAQAEYIEI